MEFGAATAALPKKVSSGYGGRSPYDGVFAAPVKLRAPSFSSRFEDYREIFSGGGAAGNGGGGASFGSSIPILELPELNGERSTTDEVRRSKLDYAAVFGGFRNLDAGVRFEELVAGEPTKQGSFANEASTRSKANGGKQSCRGDSTDSSKETCLASPPSNDAKTINMSYHKVNQGSENGTNGTTHIAQLLAVPAYTCVVEEVNPAKMNRANKSIPAVQDAYAGNHYNEANEGIKEGGRRTKSFAGPLPDNAKNQSSNNRGKVNKRSDSFDVLFDARETSNGSKGTHHIKVPPSENIAGDWDNRNGDAMRSMGTKRQASKSDTSEGAACPDSPSYLDDMVDSNSEAAASVAALRKAIEEAQLRLKVAKESMRRKKEGFPDRVKRKSNIDLKADVKQEAKVAYKTMKLEEINTRQTFGEVDALPQVSSEVRRPTKEQVRSDLGAKEMFVAKEAVRETQKKLPSTQAEHQEDVEYKEADQSAKVLELKEVENDKKVLYVKNTGMKAYEKQEESDHTIEVVTGCWEHKNNEEKGRMGNEAGASEKLANETKQKCKEKVCVGNEASACEKLVEETRHKCEEVVDETELVELTPDRGATDKRLKVNKDGEAEYKVTPFHELEDCKSNLGEQGLRTENEKEVASKPEDDGRKVEGSLELEEGKINSRVIQELSEVEKNIAEEQKVIENVEVSRELEECELTEFLEPIDNEIACSLHGSDFVSVEGEIQNTGGLEDRNKMCEAGFLDKNGEKGHPCQREGTMNMFGNVNVQEIPEEIVDHIHDEEEIYERNTKDSELDENERLHDVKASENELGGGTLLMEENKRGREDNEEAVRVTQTDPDYKEIQAEEAGKTIDTSSNYEPDETEKLSEIQVADTIIENEDLEVTPEVYSHDVQDDVMLSSHSFQHEDKYEEPESVRDTSDSFQHEDKYEEPESVQDTSDSSLHEDEYEELESFQETSDSVEKQAVETSAFIQGALELNDASSQMQCTSATVTSEGAATNIGETDMKVRQNENQCLENVENDSNSSVPVEETTAEPVEISDANAEIDENRSNSSNEENLFDNEHNIEVSQIPSMSEWKSSLFKEEEVKTIPTSVKENHQASMTMVEESNGNSQEAELEKEHLKRIDEAKERERERQREREKEKLAVERAIREARERAFADARERAALDRAAAEARQKNIDGRERLGKTVGQTSEKTLAEKAAMEAKLKVERAAVERATAEARARALERALSEKAASDARNKYDKSDKNFHSKTFSYGVRDSTDVFDGANGDSAQRCKARSERHQRIGERVAKALAEKNMRDRLVQKEQEEKNRIAEALDADVKRWSSGKAGNLRALLSTLQYILGPDSGWQPIPLTDIVAATAVKKAYRKATLFVHPDKLQQRGASIQQKYICEKVFDLLKEAWNRFNMEER